VAILRNAVGQIRVFVQGLRVSSIYRSAPRYLVDQPDFYNLALHGDTDLEPLELLGRTQGIEKELGRDRTREVAKGPRTIDIDILFYGSTRLDLPQLSIPHPGIRERAFVLVPLLELDPALEDPVDGTRLDGFLQSVAGQGIYLHAPAPL
jgi:2-amino-4-hydroxy-6-hydroxymethyldihydropteridine diphosphokinase